MSTTTTPSALSRTAALLRTGGEQPPIVDGYLDLLPVDTVRPTVGQRAMRSALLPQIYERLWRPIGFQAFTGRTTAAEHAQLLELLDLAPGDAVLDVACGPGNTTRRLQDAVGPEGLVVGFDASASMLARAVQDSDHPAVAYVRGDAHRLPFADGSFDAVCCYGALYLIERPDEVIAELARVLRPGGRVAVLTTCTRGPWPARQLQVAGRHLTSVRMFDRRDVPRAFTAAGLSGVEQHVRAFSQVVAARRAA
ncbi:methyltransferase domain-containing protein [Patulibacter defluvii]|uniref:methyltransferase domain-containing protein n=1 Tax=Patulibacter defluvii TaxID=3095358 RepID=UPI002A753913|nr:methyltransferase domain-containing protein [Patulibacter sp. DM4]